MNLNPEMPRQDEIRKEQGLNGAISGCEMLMLRCGGRAFEDLFLALRFHT